MIRAAAWAVVWLMIFLSGAAVTCASTFSTFEIGRQLKQRVDLARSCPIITLDGEMCHASEVLPRFYRQREYLPAWNSGTGPLPQAETLIRALREAGAEGLNPYDYHLARIQALLEKVGAPHGAESQSHAQSLADLDFLFTDAFLIYGSHLLRGRVDPESVEAQWYVERRERDLREVLEQALYENRIREALHLLAPTHAAYLRMRSALERYRKMAASGGWPIVPGGPLLEKGDRSERVTLLRLRLAAEGDLPKTETADRQAFDAELDQAVRRFQQRHGLKVDGVVGPKTLAALNVSAGERVRQLLVNLERWRWLPQELGPRYILVDIANFRLKVMEEGRSVFETRVVVGKPFWSTPVFNGTMTYLVLNPYWNIPTSIALGETLPKSQKDPEYLSKERIQLVQGWGPDERIIDPKESAWSSEEIRRGVYRLRQRPGPDNSLGLVKFMFPNKFNVYLHDTPAKALFDEPSRGYSHGCIRVERPIELAEYMLHDDPRWTPTDILRVLETGVEKTVSLPKPIPVYVLYWTAWAEEDGTVQFRDDIYGRDQKLLAALLSEPPRSQRADRRKEAVAN